MRERLPDAVREALAGLTLRGRAFLAGGSTAVAGAVVLNQSALSRVGVLAVALPLITVLVMSRSRHRLTLVRTVSPQLVSAGQPARVTLTLTNEGRTPPGVLRLEDRLPHALGPRPRFVLEGIGHGWRQQVSYQVSSQARGRFEIGPMTVRVTDGFGLVDQVRSFRTTVPLTVTPRTVPLPWIPLGGAWTGSGDNRPRAFATGSAEDVTVREYRRGDDLRRVHWRSSARVGELMVRREEQPWQSRATLFLDNRTRAHRGADLASSLETAVSVAASIAVHLAHRGFTVRLVTASGEEPSSAWHYRNADLNTTPLLEALAVVEATSAAHIDTSWLSDATHGGLCVGVFGGLESHDAPALRRMLLQTGTAIAIALDVEAWRTRTGGTRPASTELDAVTMLAGHGWRGVSLGPDDRIEAAWQDLGRGAVSSLAAAPRAVTAAQQGSR